MTAERGRVFKLVPETSKCWCRNNSFGQLIPDQRSRNVECSTADCIQSEHRHHQATGAGTAECPPTVQICYSVKWSKVPWRCAVQFLSRCRKLQNVGAETTPSSSSFQIGGPETLNATSEYVTALSRKMQNSFAWLKLYRFPEKAMAKKSAGFVLHSNLNFRQAAYMLIHRI